MDISETLENPAFWLLGGGGVAAVLLGWIISKRAGMEVLPTWQMLILLLTVIVASAIFSNRD